MSDIVIIAAVAQNGIIGRKGAMPWHISEDFRRFKALTTGHTVVMGRKTWESLTVRPLPGRTNIVLTRDPGFNPAGARVARTLREAIASAAPDGKIFIIGGASVYREAMEHATVLELTRLARPVDGDVRFPDFEESGWDLVGREERTDPENGAFAFCTYRKKGIA